MRVFFAGDLTHIIRVSLIVGCPVFLPERGIASLLHFVGKSCHTLFGPKGAKKEENLLQNVCYHRYRFVYTCVHFLTSQNIIGFGVFRKHPLLAKKVRGI